MHLLVLCAIMNFKHLSTSVNTVSVLLPALMIVSPSKLPILAFSSTIAGRSEISTLLGTCFTPAFVLQIYNFKETE
jgi:hypothetical protein